MAAAGLLALLDDVASVLDDVAVLTKLATKKTAGVLGDDLAVNAEQVAGVAAERELPVVWAVAKGSAWNKLILVPAALALSALAPWAVAPLLVLGGAFLCYEGFEKVFHHGGHAEDASKAALSAAVANPAVDLVALERDKIRGAIRTDFVLSAEIVVITLGIVADQPLVTRIAVLSVIAVLVTVGVYGLVAGIVKLDDVGLAWSRAERKLRSAAGHGIVAAAPYLMKTLSILGTAAMLLVGGGILTHGVPPLHHAVEGIAHAGGALAPVVGLVVQALVGVAAGALAAAGVRVVRRVLGRGSHATA
jgi:predicted DNA repair protein MutK